MGTLDMLCDSIETAHSELDRLEDSLLEAADRCKKHEKRMSILELCLDTILENIDERGIEWAKETVKLAR